MTLRFSADNSYRIQEKSLAIRFRNPSKTLATNLRTHRRQEDKPGKLGRMRTLIQKPSHTIRKSYQSMLSKGLKKPKFSEYGAETVELIIIAM